MTGELRPATRPWMEGLRAWVRRRSPATWLGLAIVVYFVVSFTFSWLRALELQTTTWDLGVYQQALWTTAHGRAFYENADVETGGFHSLLEVHTVFLLYAIAPLYAAFPYETTLFAVQSLVVATAAIPLFLLSRDVTRSPWLALSAAVVYLAWTPTLSSNLYDFHPEAFLPLELFAVVLLWERERFVAGFAVVLVAFATFELAPVLLFFVGVFFLLPSRETWLRWRAAAGGRFPWAAWIPDIRRALASPRVQASVALLASSAVAYFFLVYLRVDLLASTLGTSALAASPTGYVIGGTPASLGLAIENLAVGFGQKLTYWLLLVALLGFIPLLAPRALVLSVPWFVFTMLSSNLNYVQLGFQYGFIAAAPLLVAFAFGLPKAVSLAEAWVARSAEKPSGSPRPPAGGGRSAISRHLPRAFVGGLILLIAVNVALSPVNPLMENQGLGSAYRVSYTSTSGFASVEQLVGLIPSGATVIASDNLFPLVANDGNAYTFFWVSNSLLALPFNASHLPQYVLLASNRTAAVPSWLSNDLYNPEAFGVRAVDWSSIAGPILLFQSGYGGALTVYGSPLPTPFVTGGAALVDTAAGYVTAAPGTDGRDVIASAPGALGPFFEGPGGNLPAGNYSVSLLVHATSLPGAAPPTGSQPALGVTVTAFAQPTYFNESVAFGGLTAPGWTVVTLNVTLPGPTIEFSVEGTILGTNVQLLLGQLEIIQR